MGGDAPGPHRWQEFPVVFAPQEAALRSVLLFSASGELSILRAGLPWAENFRVLPRRWSRKCQRGD